MHLSSSPIPHEEQNTVCVQHASDFSDLLKSQAPTPPGPPTLLWVVELTWQAYCAQTFAIVVGHCRHRSFVVFFFAPGNYCTILCYPSTFSSRRLFGLSLSSSIHIDVDRIKTEELYQLMLQSFTVPFLPTLEEYSPRRNILASYDNLIMGTFPLMSCHHEWTGRLRILITTTTTVHWPSSVTYLNVQGWDRVCCIID